MHPKSLLLKVALLFALLVPLMLLALGQMDLIFTSLINHQERGPTISGSNLFDTSRNGKHTLIGTTQLGQGASFVVLDVVTGKSIRLRSPEDVFIVREGVGSISPSGKLAAAGFITNGYDAKIAWWRVQEAPEQINELTLQHAPNCIKWKSDHELYVGTNTLEVLEIRKGRIVRRQRLLRKYNEFVQLAFAPDSKTFAVVVDRDPKDESQAGGKPRYAVLLCRLDNEKERVRRIFETNTKIRHLEFSDDGKVLIVGANSDDSILVKSQGNGEIIICQLSDEGDVDKTVYSAPKFWSVALDPGNEILAIGGIYGEIRLLKIDTRKVLHAFPAHTGPIVHLRFREEGKSLMSGSSEGEVRLWDSKTGKMQREFNVMKDLSNSN